MSERFGHVKFDDKSKGLGAACMNAVVALEAEIDKIPLCRAKALAFQRLEEAAMWVNKAIREVQQERGAEAKPTLKQAVIVRRA